MRGGLIERSRKDSGSWEEEDADRVDLSRVFPCSSILDGAEVARTAGAAKAFPPPTFYFVVIASFTHGRGELVNVDKSVGEIDHQHCSV